MYRKEFGFAMGFVLLFSLVSVIGFSIGITPSSLRVDYSPELNYSNGFRIFNNDNETIVVDLYAKGYLSENIMFEYEKLTIPPGERLGSAFYLDFPDDINPGSHVTRIGAVENVENLDGIAVAGAAEMLLLYTIPYPPKYLEVGLRVDDFVDNMDRVAIINIDSKGNDSVDSSGSFSVYDVSGTLIYEIDIEMDTYSSESSKEFDLNFNTGDFDSGNYTGSLLVSYIAFDGENVDIRTNNSFLVGYPEVVFESVDLPFVVQGDLGELKIEGRNTFLGDLRNIRTELDLGDRSFSSSEFSVGPNETFFDNVTFETADMEFGIYDANITLKYSELEFSSPARLVILPKNYLVFLISLVVFILLMIAFLKGSFGGKRK